MCAMPRRQDQLTPEQRKALDKILTRINKAQADMESAQADLDAFLQAGASVPATARAMGLTPETLYRRVRGK